MQSHTSNAPVLLHDIATSVEQLSEPRKPQQKLPVGLLFPGQGAQAVGMLSKAKDIPAVRELITQANEILGYDLLEMCLKGPMEKLTQTVHCQPAIFVASLAAVEILRQKSPEKVNKCQAVAGFSLGEVTALVFSGVLSLKEGLSLVKVRAEAMDAATKVGGSQKMVSVVGLPRSKVESMIGEIKAKHPNDVLQIANELFSTGFSCAGSGPAVEALAALAKSNKAMATILATSGAFHSPMMQPALEPLTKRCSELSQDLKPANCTVYSDAIAKPYEMDGPNQVASFMELLPKQIVSPVKWDSLVRQMIADGVTEFIEVGPGKQLSAMMRRIDPNAFKTTSNVDA